MSKTFVVTAAQSGCVYAGTLVVMLGYVVFENPGDHSECQY